MLVGSDASETFYGDGKIVSFLYLFFYDGCHYAQSKVFSSPVDDGGVWGIMKRTDDLGRLAEAHTRLKNG